MRLFPFHRVLIIFVHTHTEGIAKTTYLPHDYITIQILIIKKHFTLYIVTES